MNSGRTPGNCFYELANEATPWRTSLRTKNEDYGVVANDQFTVVESGSKDVTLINNSTGEIEWVKSMRRGAPIRQAAASHGKLFLLIGLKLDVDWVVLALETRDKLDLDNTWQGLLAGQPANGICSLNR